MIGLRRKEPAPASLSSPANLARLAATERHFATGAPGSVTFEGYAEYDVRQALLLMSNRKCSYCEGQVQKGTFEVEHYRPKGGVRDCPHPGYWWLAWTWSNLLPTCPGCNQGLLQHVVTADMTLAEVEAMQAKRPRDLYGKATQFPVSGTRLIAKEDDHEGEGPLIIDPTRTDPAPHLRWRHEADYSVVQAADVDGAPSAQGQATIDCLALNRVDLVQSRTQILDRLRFQRTKIIEDLEADAAHPELAGTAVLCALRRVDDLRRSCRPDQPYSAMAKAYVAALAQELDERLVAMGQGD